jgi:hypothetical protein
MSCRLTSDRCKYQHLNLLENTKYVPICMTLKVQNHLPWLHVSGPEGIRFPDLLSTIYLTWMSTVSTLQLW